MFAKVGKIINMRLIMKTSILSAIHCTHYETQQNGESQRLNHVLSDVGNESWRPSLKIHVATPFCRRMNKARALSFKKMHRRVSEKATNTKYSYTQLFGEGHSKRQLRRTLSSKKCVSGVNFYLFPSFFRCFKR